MTTYRQHELVLVGKNFDWFTICLVLAVKFDLLIIGNNSENDLHQFGAQRCQIQTTTCSSTQLSMSPETSQEFKHLPMTVFYFTLLNTKQLNQDHIDN